MLRKIIAGLGGCSLAATIFAADAIPPSIIPLPQKMELRDGSFQLEPDTTIYADEESSETGNYLAKHLARATGWDFKVSRETTPDSMDATAGGIFLTAAQADTNLGAEGYALTVATNRVVIRAPTQAGLFYGVQTLLQLLPPAVFSTNIVTNADWRAPCVEIEDWPRFKWRGMMLDVSRHFFTKQEVERLLDAMALHKLNVFHWHLADDQGWRIEIKKYPKLASVGAWRSGVGFGLDPKSTTAYGPDGRYGGFYTQDDIREVVHYAQTLHITVVPEIEMPGHSMAALAAYPELSCSGKAESTDVGAGVNNGVFCAGREETFEFLENVLTEIFELFPSPYIHIGGDEVPKNDWKKCPLDQARMKQEGLTNEEQLQSWFIRRIGTFISARGRTMIGWNEILQGGLAPDAVVMAWSGGARQAASTGHDVIMTPTSNCYFDYAQSTNRMTEPPAGGGVLTLEKVYALEPVPARLAPEMQRHILGAQGNVWTEYIPNFRHLEYMTFPRLCALAEVTWSARDARNLADFRHRLQVHEQRLDELGINYRRGP